MTGNIKSLPPQKQFGFITYEGATKDLFFHANDLKDVSLDELKVNDVVNFDVVDTERGPAAKNVTKA